MEILIGIVFILGYFAITFEHKLQVNKAAIAILTGVLCWTIYVLSTGESVTVSHVPEALAHHLGDISAILFFLLGAMTIVELIDAHDGFDIITDYIKTRKKRTLLWIIALLSFFLSAILDNLTTAIVMVALLDKLLYEKEDKWFFAGVVIIGANAGGAWSPIGDVTTTMLWIGGQITSPNIIARLFLPSLTCLLVPLIFISLRMKGEFEKKTIIIDPGKHKTSVKHQYIIFFSGLAVLLFVPVFKTITHLPPYMGILLGLGILWILSEIIHKDKDEADKDIYSVVHALRKIDVPSILFFLGILLSVAALEATGVLRQCAAFLDHGLKDINLIVLSIGLLSAIVDNVPLVAAAQGMYDLSIYPTDHYFWEFLAYTAGTGGSVLIIGSAAGVAAMGMEKIDFFWYLKKISWLALIGYFSGALIYIFLN
ncbi:MAG TPA: sodium:proton antiporter NhaD [Bacteroidia bacterium]|jgi:Na+/H+ antiporter NhaD/arsenite permease-like protein